MLNIMHYPSCYAYPYLWVGGQMDRQTYSQHFLEFGSYHSFCYLNMCRRRINHRIFIQWSWDPWMNMKKHSKNFEIIF